MIPNAKGRELIGSVNRNECVDRTNSIGSGSVYSESSSFISSTSSCGDRLPLLRLPLPFNCKSFGCSLFASSYVVLLKERNTNPDVPEGSSPEPSDCRFIINSIYCASNGTSGGAKQEEATRNEEAEEKQETCKIEAA